MGKIEQITNIIYEGHSLIVLEFSL